MKKLSVFVCFLVIMGLFASILSGCGKQAVNETSKTESSTQHGTTQAATENEEPLLEYTYLDAVHATAPFGYNNPNDVVTPVIEKKFNIKLKEVIYSAGQVPVEKITMMIAADNLPDVVAVDNPNIPIIYGKGAFAELEQYKELMVNTDKVISDTGWNMLKVDGKLVALPSGGDIDLGNPEVAEMAKNDAFFRPMSNWALMAREDILKLLGYKFKPLKDIQAEMDSNPRRITEADVALDPPIKTVIDLEKLLYDIKALNIKVNGKPLIPLSIPDWGAHHMTNLFAPNPAFACDPDTMTVTGFILNPFMKDFYRTFAKWFQDGILDNNYLIQKPEQLQENAASGRIAMMLWAPDANAVRASLKYINPEAELRPIPWPKSKYEEQTGRQSYIDPSYPCGFFNYMINKDFKDIPRLLKYFDWFQTEEAMDLATWGPESAGLYEVKNGRKVFKDSELWKAISEGGKTEDGRNAEYYGLYDFKNVNTFYTGKAYLCAPAPMFNYKTYQHSYPAKFDAWLDMWNYVTTGKLCRDGTMLSQSGEKSNYLSNYMWNTTRTLKVSRLLAAKTDEEFDKYWEETVKDLKDNGNYDEAIAEMTPLFKRILGK